MKIFLFHCWGGESRSCWSGYIIDEFTKKRVEVVSPDFPNSGKPWLPDWLKVVREKVPSFHSKDEWVLVGHSLGCPTILRLLESFGPKEKVKAVILVASFAKDLFIPEIQNFVFKDFDWAKIKAGSKKFIVINSNNDPYIELNEGERIANLLGAEFIVEEKGGHINEGSGFTTYPRLKEIIETLG